MILKSSAKGKNWVRFKLFDDLRSIDDQIDEIMLAISKSQRIDRFSILVEVCCRQMIEYICTGNYKHFLCRSRHVLILQKRVFEFANSLWKLNLRLQTILIVRIWVFTGWLEQFYILCTGCKPCVVGKFLDDSLWQEVIKPLRFSHFRSEFLVKLVKFGIVLLVFAFRHIANRVGWVEPVT